MRRPLVTGGLVLASMAYSSVALAQQHIEVPVGAASTQAASAGSAHHEGAEGEHAGGEHGAEAHHDPAPFNLADVARYQAEKEAASRGAKDAHGNPVTPVTPYAYLVINALILYAIYYYAGRKPIGAALESRRATVAKELDEAARVKKEAEARLSEYAGRLDKLDAELTRIKTELVEAGKADRSRIITDAEEKASRMRKDAEFILEQELKQVRIDLQRYTVDAAIAAATKVLEQRINAQDHERLGDEYVKQVASAPATGAQGGAS
jgi:F-type H+-transporting ATPase subunit b